METLILLFGVSTLSATFQHKSTQTPAPACESAHLDDFHTEEQENICIEDTNASTRAQQKHTQFVCLCRQMCAHI